MRTRRATLEHRPEQYRAEPAAYRGPRRHLVPLAASIAAHAALLAAIIYLLPPLTHRPTSIVLAYLIEVGDGGGLALARGRHDAAGGATASAGSLAPAPPIAHRHGRRAVQARDDSSSRNAAAPDAAVAAVRPGSSSAHSELPAARAAARGAGDSGGAAAGQGARSASAGAGGSGGVGAGSADGSGTSGAFARYGDNPPPSYPFRARRRGEQGTVTLHVLVAADGAVERVELAESSGFDALDRAALETVRSRWRFVPARRGGAAVESWVLVPIRFTLAASVR
jgi:periplasmic protein TonB